MEKVEVVLTYQQIEDLYNAMQQAEQDDCHDAMAFLSIEKEKKNIRGKVIAAFVRGSCVTEYSTGNIW